MLIILGSCSVETPSRYNLESAIVEIEKHPGIDTIRFDDSLLIRKFLYDKEVYLFRKQKELGTLFKVDEYLKIYPDKMKGFPRLNESDYIFGYGETRFSNSCITCHDPQKIHLQKWSEIEKNEKPVILHINNSNYYFIKSNDFHWNFSLMQDYEKNALKEYIGTTSKMR